MYNLNSLHDDSGWKRGSQDLRDKDDLLETYAAVDAIERAVSVFLCVCVCDFVCLCVYIYIYGHIYVYIMYTYI